ncbi:hypothetical protein JTE90_006601 [Oedothorax gibbosus]|uniref:Secreted protein n=1 Tax=Oedothorax gibbosus TaxID=931172 RepID=A0AAV6U4J7_9ARAC|nr:hypothetical protein JTE90_006601 [Oedothorax gibbosus]
MNWPEASAPRQSRSLRRLGAAFFCSFGHSRLAYFARTPFCLSSSIRKISVVVVRLLCEKAVSLSSTLRMKPSAAVFSHGLYLST